jgi:cobalt-zinc-cadmium efflux system outer membrane protein
LNVGLEWIRKVRDARRDARAARSRRLTWAAALAFLASVTMVRPARAEWLTLDQVVARVRVQALAVADARGNVGVAEAAGVGARLSPFTNPYLEVQVDRGRATQDVQIQGLLFLPFEVNGQRGTRIREAEGLLAWRKVGLADAQARAMGEAIAAYGDVLTAATRLGDVMRAEEEAKNELSYFAQRMALGESTVFERSLAEAEVARWAQTRVETQLRLVNASARLSVLIGAQVDAPPASVRASIPDLRIGQTDSDVAAIVEGSPQIAAVRKEIAYWDASRERVSREKFVPVNVLVVGGRGDLGEPRIGGGLSWTFPVTRRNQGEIANAEAQGSRAMAVAERLRQVVDVRVRAALQSYALSRAAVAEQDATGIPATERMVDAALTSYRAGKGEILRVFIARRDLLIARGRRLDLIQSAWNAYGELAAFKGDLP